MKKIIIVLLCVALGSELLCGCKGKDMKADNIKIHAIVFCNTDDPKIGEGCLSDQERFAEELAVIETAIGCEEDWQVFIGKECNKPNLERALSNLHCSPNDVVFFYYSGHGVHAEADPANGWLPQMCLNYESYDQDKFVPITFVRDQLATKSARLSIIITDCRNNDSNWVSVKSILSEVKDAPNTSSLEARLKKLFYESQGTVIATSSKHGQPSYGSKEGGCFSVAFWDEIYRVEQGQGNADWKSVMEETRKRTLRYTGNKQEPVFDIVENGVNPGFTSTTPPIPEPVNSSAVEKE